MYEGYVWGFTMAILGALVSLTAFQLLMAAAAPGAVAQAARNLERGRIRSHFGYLVLGVFEIGLWFQILTGFSNGPPIVKVLLAVPVFAPLFLLGGGLAAASLCVGNRLASPADAGRPWRRIICGSATLGFSWLVPFLGWIVISIGTAAVGLGAITVALFQRAARREAAADLRPAAIASEPTA